MKNEVIIRLSVLLFITLGILTSCTKEEKQIKKWIVGTWNIDRYVQQNFNNGQLTGESESTDQGLIEFKNDGTGYDIGGNFIGGEFTWTNTDKTLSLTSGGGLTVYDIEEYSDNAFVFSITDIKGDNKDVERWYLSK